MLFVTLHHLIVDGVSWRILLQDLVDELTGVVPAAASGDFAEWAFAAAEQRDGRGTAVEAPPLPTDFICGPGTNT
jgi:hypothetical protein